MKISNYFIHKGEEDCLSKGKGSGLICFTGCNMHCCYCNIYQSSQLEVGYEISKEDLLEIMFTFQAQGCNNLNLVNIVKHSDEIIGTLADAKEQGLKLPVVYNSNGYEPAELLERLSGLVDIYLVDFKYGSNEVGSRYSKVNDYADVFMRGIHEMYRQVGKVKTDAEKVILKGIIIRHLLLPSNASDSLNIMKQISKLAFKKDVLVSLLDQYIPEYHSYYYPEIHRRLSEQEYNLVRRYAAEVGLNIL